MADRSIIKELAEKWLNGTITEAEKEIFEQWYNGHPEQVVAWTGENNRDELRETMLSGILEGIEQEKETAAVIPINYRKIFLRIAAAAAVLILLIGGGYRLFVKQGSSAIAKIDKPAVHNVPPGREGAVLTLNDGTKISMDNAANGNIAQQGDAKVEKQNGLISYAIDKTPTDNKPLYNTMTTPKGMKYQLILSDGSKVWLNAASSVTYPTTFTGNERRVSITGEAYFEIAHNEKQPFFVVKGNTSVQVLGTHFNVNAYDDENDLRVTLLEGSVNVRSENGDRKLTLKIKPNEQAVVRTDGQLWLDRSADIDAAMAWKNGFFSFKDAGIRTVMRQLSRWYDIDVVYEGNNNNETFSGRIGRGLTLKDLLDGLAQTRVHYKIEEGRKLVILP